jgi:hypothetical protein
MDSDFMSSNFLKNIDQSESNPIQISPALVFPGLGLR